MSDKIRRVTPREIAEMIVNEQAYADTRFVLATEHDAEIERMRARVEMLERSSRELLDTLSAAVRSGNFTLSGSEDMSLFVNAALNKLEEATT